MKTLAQYLVAIIGASTVLVAVVPPMVNAANTVTNRLGFLIMAVCVLGIIAAGVGIIAKSSKYW